MAAIDRSLWAELGPLLDRALELTAEQRDGWLDQLTTTAPEVAAALRSLLAAESLADRRGFLTESIAFQPVASLVGLELGHYALVRPLGHGGMGSVWLARRTDGRYEGQAAIKLMSLTLMTEAGQARFRREGTALARLTHPAIARLLDAGVAPSGQPYLVIEYVDGQRIDAYADAAALTRDDRLRLALQVLDAVGHAHANLIVHRDLKPSNILVTAQGQAKLLDFGIAKLLQDDDERTILTREGGGALTPDYASPEQVTGDPITTATDVYALGVLLYVLISGRHPTRGAGATAAETVRAVLEVEPKRLGLGDLDNILVKALRKAPGERYQTVSALADDLRRYLGHEPVSAQPDSLRYRARKFIRRNRAGVAAAAAIAGVLIGATVFSVAQARRAIEQRDRATAEARRAAELSQLQGFLGGDNLEVGGQPLSAKDRIARAEEMLVQKYRRDPWFLSEMLVHLGGTLANLGDVDATLAFWSRTRAIARQAGHHMVEAMASCVRAGEFWQTDQRDSLRHEIADARAALIQVKGIGDSTARAMCLHAEAKGLQAEGNADSAVKMAYQAYRLLESDEGMTYRKATRLVLAEMLRLAGRPREGLPYLGQVLAELEGDGFANTAEVSTVASLIEGSLANLGEYRVADSVLGGLIRSQEARVGPDRVSGLLAFLYGQNKLRLGEIDSADQWVGRVTDETAQRLPNVPNWLPSAQALIRLEQGRPAEAQAAAASLPPAGTLRGRRATNAMVRARLRYAQADRAGARGLLEGELSAMYRESPATLPHFALPLVTAGEWRLISGDARGADSLAQLAVKAAALDSLAFTHSALVGRAELLRARALAAATNPAARAAAERAAVALTNGYGADNRWTRSARALLDSLPR